jgi:Domain of unknown function (DUF932)
MTINAKLSRPRILRSQADRPLTLAEIEGCAPAVFAKHPYQGTSPSYAYIPTIDILEKMLAEGFTVHEVAQARPYRRERDPYAKHMLRLRYQDSSSLKKVGDVVPELVLVNAHDGTARYYLYAGMYRLICSNGMVVGATFASVVVAHRGGDTTRSRVLEGSYEILNEQFPAVAKAVVDMKKHQLTAPEQKLLAEEALALRYPNMVPPFKAEQLLEVRRPQDASNDTWTVMNRIQENVIQGGFHSRSFLYERQTTIRPVERVNSIVGINRGLWDAAMDLLHRKAA